MAEVEAEAASRNAPLRAVIYMVAAVSSLAVLDVGVKWLAADYAVTQIAFLRYIVGLALAVALAPRFGGISSLRTRRLPGHMLRSVLNLGTMLMFYLALALMPLADVVSITFAAPLFVTALSVPLLRERVGPRRWSAVVVGFAGVLIILRPSGAGLDPAALLALGSAFLYALTSVTARQLTRTEPSHRILFYYSIGVLLTMGAAMPWQWTTPAPGDLWIFLLIGVTGSIGQFFLNQALRYGEVSLLAPIEYLALPWAIVFGLVIWNHVPGPSVLAGAAVVIASSLYIVHREAVLGQGGLRRGPVHEAPSRRPIVEP